MNQTLTPRTFLITVAALGGVFLSASAVSAQTTFRACRVPDVGAIYMIGVQGAPNECLDATHVEFSWTEGVGAGTIGTTQLADDAVTAAKIGSGAVGSLQLASDAVNGTKVVDASITSFDLADGAVTAPKLGVEVVSVFVQEARTEDLYVGTATCPGGKRVIAGGFVHSSVVTAEATDSFVTANQPFGDDTWRVAFRDPSPYGINSFSVYAVCIVE